MDQFDVDRIVDRLERIADAVESINRKLGSDKDEQVSELLRQYLRLEKNS